MEQRQSKTKTIHTLISNQIMNTANDESWMNQPYFVVGDRIYSNLKQKLNNGSKGEWFYLCPSQCKANTGGVCDCAKLLNVLRDGKIMRLVKGTWKPVYSVSYFKKNIEKTQRCEIQVWESRFLENRNAYLNHLKSFTFQRVTFPCGVKIHYDGNVRSGYTTNTFTCPTAEEFHKIIEFMGGCDKSS